MNRPEALVLGFFFKNYQIDIMIHLKNKLLLGIIAVILHWGNTVMAQSQLEISTIEIAQTVLDKGLSDIDLGYYPGTLLLHAMAELTVNKNNPAALSQSIDLFEKFSTGKIKGHGSFISYQYGGSGVPYLVWKENLSALKSQMQEGAVRMYKEQKRSSEGILVPPWVKSGMDQVFIDMAFAVTPYLLYAGLELNNKSYVDTAVMETLELFRILEDKNTGLLHQSRGFQEVGKTSEDNWSRGNGWGAFALATLVRDLPQSHPKKSEVEELAKQFFKKLIEFQNEEGLWHQEMTDPTSYIETSGSGLLLYGMGIMLEKGLLSESYFYNFKKGIRGYTSYIGSDGSVSHTCGGCLSPGQGTKEDYINKPWIYNDEHAFGPAVLAFTQAAKMGIEKIVPLKRRGLYCISNSPEMPRTYLRAARETDIAWENDRIAYRVFGPSVRTKVGNGIDVWAKSVDYPILDKWYQLNKEGQDYHVDRGEGSDFYNAGKQFGCGGIAVWVDGKPYPSETYDTFKIVQNQNDKISFELNYDTWNVPGMELKEHKVIEMGMDTHLFKVTSTIKCEIDREITVAIGLTSFGKQKVIQDPKKGVLILWESMDQAHGGLGTSILVNPKDLIGFAHQERDEFILIRATTNVAFTYYSGAGWDGSQYIKGEDDWVSYIEKEVEKIEF